MRHPLMGLVDLDHRAGGLTRQLCTQVRTLIANGRVSPGDRLPSSRVLAEHLGVSRNTVSAAIDQLAAEGYVDSSRGRRPRIVDALAPMLISRGPIERSSPVTVHRLSSWARRIARSEWPFTREGRPRPFLPGLPDAREFPHDVWACCLRRAARHGRARRFTPHNRPALQEALIRHLRAHRGVDAEARQVVITPSAQAAIDLVARVILNTGDVVWMESPGYGGARVALEAAGALVRGVAVDANGLMPRGPDRPRLIFVTPSHQYPTGRLMPIGRRLELLRFAASVGAAIVEDDYDSEFHYDGRPIAALHGLDGSGRVLYVGTFSKSMLADVRVGYAVVPEGAVETFERAQRHTGHVVPAVLQDALSEFIGDGTYAAHVRRVTRIYRARRDCLVEALVSEVGDTLVIDPPAGGMQMLARYRARRGDREIVAALAEAGVTARPLSTHFIGRTTERGLFLGFAAWNEREIDAGARVIGEVLRTTLGR